MKLLGRRTSINVQKVLWALAEMGAEATQIDLGGKFGGLDDPDYRRLNPMGKVPTLIDGDLVLWESNAILRYVSVTHAQGRLAGKTPADRARADIWMEWFQNNLYADLTSVFSHSFRLPPSRRDPQLLDGALTRLNAGYDVLNRHLSDRPFVTGNDLSMGDIPVGASLYRYFTLDIERPDFPALADYYERLKARTPYRETVMVSYQELRIPGD